MTTRTDWRAVEVLPGEPIPLDHPIESLARADVPAIIFRDAYPPEMARRLVRNLIAAGHLYDPFQPAPPQFLERSVPEGNFNRNRSVPAEASWRDTGLSPKRRIDIGASLGNLGFDKERFLAKSAETHTLFERLFDGFIDPVALLYEKLQSLVGAKRVTTAREPDGRAYGPAIIRAHYGGYAYAPHFDSVRLREDRSAYAVYGFDHQLAGLVVLENTEKEGQTAQAILHRQLWSEEVDGPMKAGEFHAFAARNGIENVTVHLEPGDCYFFNTRLIHEVPGIEGQWPRVVLATFIGYSPDRDEVFVWS